MAASHDSSFSIATPPTTASPSPDAFKLAIARSLDVLVAVGELRAVAIAGKDKDGGAAPPGVVVGLEHVALLAAATDADPELGELLPRDGVHDAPALRAPRR